jgi:hypothetical protein
MLSNVSQYSPQGLLPQFAAPQAAGWPQPGSGQFGQQAAYGYGAGQFGQESGQGFGQHGFGQQGFGQHPFANGWSQPGPLPPQLWQAPFASQGGALNSVQHISVQHIVAALTQLAQQISVQNTVTQQVGTALVQLAQQLTMQNLQPPLGLGLASPFAGAGQPIGAGQPFGIGAPFAGGMGTQYGQYGLTPQAQAWGANRPQTIQ